jgi:DNA-binding NarL/FixJ family response regulator
MNPTTVSERADKIANRDQQIFLAYDAQQAFQLMQRLGGAVALVDLDLQGKHGPSLMEKLRERLPDLPVIVISSLLGTP